MDEESRVGSVSAALIVVVLAALLYLHFWGPCEAFAWASSKDIPARCLAHYTNGQP